MAFFHQLRLLLWKNSLVVLRQPGWSVTVILWPIIIIVILAITRKQFPPQMKEPCYVEPRNLPSAGFFPFLQTLMCNGDSTCNNKSRLLVSSKSFRRSQTRRSLNSLQTILQTGSNIRSALMHNSTGNPAEILALWSSSELFTGVAALNNKSHTAGPLASPFSTKNTTEAMLEPLSELKKAMCTAGLAMVNSSSGQPLSYALVTFCQSNSTLLEVSLLTLNQILTELMKSEPNAVVEMAGHTVVMFDQLQDHGALWDSLLALPHLFYTNPVDQSLVEVEALLTNTQGAVHMLQESFPEAGAALSQLHPILAGGINIIRYIQKWHGRDVYITLGDIVTLQNDTLSEVAKQVLREIRIPLDKAICLLLDRSTVHSYICQNTSSSLGLTTACMTGLVDTLLGWISPEKVAKQLLLTWSKEVAHGDMTFIQGVFHSVMGEAMGGPQDSRRRRRSVDTEGPQNIDEDLFLNLGHVVLDGLKAFPEADIVIQRILKTGFFSIHTANLVISNAEKIIVSVLKDVHHLQNIYMMLMGDESGAGAWMDQVLNSTAEMVMEVLIPTGPSTCERLMRPYEWLLQSESLDPEVCIAIICQNMTNLEQSLAMEWWPLFHMVESGYNSTFSQQGDNVTLPMILSEWHKLWNNTMYFPVVLNGTVMNILADHWMSDGNSYNISKTLLQSVMLAVANLGKNIEGSLLWPQVGHYVHMASWIINYNPGNTTEPANCYVDTQTMDVYCKVDVDWTQLVQATAQAMNLLPHEPDILIRYLKGTLRLLEHIYGDTLKHLITSHIPQQIPGGNALSHYMINLIHNLHGFALKLTTLSDSEISDPHFMLPYIETLLQSTGLTPLMSLFQSSEALNTSTILDVVLKLGRQNQHLFTFNETDPTLPNLEWLIMKLLSLEANLTFPLSLNMGQTLLTYSGYLNPEHLADLQLAIQPYVNQTSAGFTEAVLSAMQLLKTLTDAPDGDPTDIILSYVQKVKEFLLLALRLQRTDQVWLSNGELSTGQVTNLQLVTADLLQLLTPESLQGLTQARPNTTLQLIMQKLIAFLPVEAQVLATDVLQDVLLLERQMSFCMSTGQNCVESISEIFTFLQQVMAMMQAGEGNVTIQIAQSNPFLQPTSSLNTTTTFISLLLHLRDNQYNQLIHQTLYFITLVMDTEQLSVAQVQDALSLSNLTLAELEEYAALFGAADINSLLVNVVGLFDIDQCFAPEPSPNMMIDCAMGLISSVSGFLSNLPALRNESLIFALIPTILNESIHDAQHVNLSRNPHLPIIQVLNSTLANVKISLHRVSLNSPELMQELTVLQSLLEFASIQPYSIPHFSNITMINDSYQTHLEIVQWYLGRLENITSGSQFSSYLNIIYHMAKQEVALQLSSAKFSMFVSNQLTNLINKLQYPLDGEGVKQIGLVIIELVREEIKLVLMNINQNDFAQSLGHQPYINETMLNAFSEQTGWYLDLIGNWMREPNITLVFDRMIHWGNSSLSNLGNDIHQLLQTVGPYLNKEQLASFSAIYNVTQAINKALAVAEQPGGLQSDQFLDAILEMLQHVMRTLNAEISPLSPELQHHILAITEDTLRLTVNSNMNYDSAHNISLQIMRMAQMLIRLVLPNNVSNYLISGIEIFTTYFETISMSDGQDTWNQIILNEIKIIHGLLSNNSTAEAYMTIILDITHTLVAFNQDNMNLWASVGNSSLSDLSVISQIQMLLKNMWPIFMEHLGLSSDVPPIMAFGDLAPILKEIMTGSAHPGTWYKLEMMLNTLLSMLQGTSMWDDHVVSMIETLLHTQVQNIQAQSELMRSLQGPLLTLTAQLVASINSSHFNWSLVDEQLELAIDHTVMAAVQMNGTLECHQVVLLWEPVSEAAGVDPNTLQAWCRVSLQPILQAQIAMYNLSGSNATPGAANATAATLTGALRSLYHAFINNSYVAEQLVTAVYAELSAVHPLSPEAQAQWYQALQDKQLQQSLVSLEMFLDELVTEAPFLQAEVEAINQAAKHLLRELYENQNGNTSEDIFGKTVFILLHSLNLTELFLPMDLDNVTALDGPSLYNLMNDVVNEIVQAEVFGDMPELYRCMERFMATNGTRVFVEELAELLAWVTTMQASEVNTLPEFMSRMHAVFKTFLDALKSQLDMELLENTGLYGDFVWNLVQMVTSIAPMENTYIEPQWESVTWGYANNGTQWPESKSGAKTRRRREVPTRPISGPTYILMDLFSIDYPTLSQAVSIKPSQTEVLETVHMFFANPDLKVVMNGLTQDMPWNEDTSSGEEDIDVMLDLFAYLSSPEVYESPWTSMDQLSDVAHMLPKYFPYSELIKNITTSLALESQENIALLQQTALTMANLINTSMKAEGYPELLQHFSYQVCALENMDAMRMLLGALYVAPGQLCDTLMPAMHIIAQSLPGNFSGLTDALFSILVGEPLTYKLDRDWTNALTQSFGVNLSSIEALNFNITKPDRVLVREMLRNEAAFIMDIEQHMIFDPHVLHLLLNSTLPNNLMTLDWLINLRHCTDGTSYPQGPEGPEHDIYKTFCSLSAQQWYTFLLLTGRHINLEKLIYRLVMSEELQSLATAMLQMTTFLTDMMEHLKPIIQQLEGFLVSLTDLNLMAEPRFRRAVRSNMADMTRSSMLTMATRALCNHGIMALFGITNLVGVSESDPSSQRPQEREEMITKFKIPRDATPFCMNLYLDMVNTTGGAISWAFLKPMLMGQVLFTPDTPTTRAIMEKSNNTLREFANLTQYSQDWIESSDYILESAKTLTHTLPLLQNSLGNPFVQKFIEMQTDINVGKLKETLSNFANMTVMLQKNKQVLKQITTLSKLMINISSCIKFDRYRGYDSAEELNADAQELAKNRDLYASVIFNLPGEAGKSKANGTHPSSAALPGLPPHVEYTIRMHMDNVMRTDRVRPSYFVKDTHIRPRQTMRYTRGFIYLQESIDRAIIAWQTGSRVAEQAVQLQPFPYPCFLRDEYLEAISFVFPLMLMVAWVLFVADFVKKLVHERELRLHEYMKMMGVNPLSHFFAWFLDCASHLLFTVIILTLVVKFSSMMPYSDGFLLFLFFCDYALSIVAISYLVSSFFDQTYIAGLTGSLVYVLCFFPFIIVMGLESTLTFSQKSTLGLLAPTCFSYATQYILRYESQGQGIHWGNAYSSPIAEDTSSFGWLCWLLVIDSLLYFLIGGYIRMVFPGKYGLASPWYFPVTRSFWAGMWSHCSSPAGKQGSGLFFTNILQTNQPVFPDEKHKDKKVFSSPGPDQEFRDLPVGVTLQRLTKMYGERVALSDLSVSFYEGHVTSLLGHNGAGKTTTMSLLTGLFAPTSGSIEVYGRDMQANIKAIRKDLGVCMQYDVLFDHMTTKEHLLLYGQIKAPQWTRGQLHEQVRKTLEETGMYAHRHKRVGTLSGGMKRKLSISISFIGGSRLVVLDEPTTGVDPCSRRSIWDMVIQHKTGRTIIMSTHHLDEAEVLSDRIAFLESGGLKCCGSPLQLKDQLGQGYKLTLTRKVNATGGSTGLDTVDLKDFIQTHVPEARLKEAQGNDLVYTLPPFTSASASSYRSLLSALDANLDALELGCYGISDTTLEEVFLQLTQTDPHSGAEDAPLSISESVSETSSMDSFSEDAPGGLHLPGDNIHLTGSSTVGGAALLWQQVWAMLVKRFHHSRRDWKGLITQVLLPVVFVVFAMGLGSIKSDLQHYPKMELSPALYNIGPSYSFFSNRNRNPSSSRLVDAMLSFPGIDNACLGNEHPDQLCTRGSPPDAWVTSGNKTQVFSTCECTSQEQVCSNNTYKPPHMQVPSSQMVYNLTGLDVENYLMATANDYIRNRYGGFDVGQPIPPGMQMDLQETPKNRSLAKVWYNPEGHHSMPAYLNSLNNLILRSNLPADKDPQQYAISISSHPYFGRADDEDAVVHGMIQILVALCVLTGFAIMTSSFAVYEVYEHHNGAKRLQHISGIGEPLYWLVNFLYDMALYLIPLTLTVAVIAAFQIPAFNDRQNLAAVTLLLILFGFSTFPWMYLLAGVFKDAEMAFISYVCINLFVSINTVLPTSILYFMGQLSQTDTEAIQQLFQRLSQGLLIFPQFCFGNGLIALARTNMEVQLLSGYGVDAYKDPFSAEALGPMFLASFLQGLVFMTLRLLLNRWLIRKVRSALKHLSLRKRALPPVVGEGMGEDEDVRAEHLRVSSGAATSDVLQVCRLSKVYQHLNKKVHAVNQVSLGIPAGECFGLLGENGAGKTTTFKMLTGDISPSDGTAQIKNVDGRVVDIMECRDQGINIGYCPQVDALDNLLTGKEHLYFYARIRGISKREIDGVVNYLLKKLELVYHRDTITDSYSCGTRRKLSTALALIGHPQILLLDEPSSGMDPRTKRHLWRIISEEVKGKCAVVLTSHSMEECEALCSRLAIMVKGQFQCLGSLQHIKNRFGSGFTLKMYLALASCDVDAITAFMQLNFPSTYLKDQHSTMVEYHVPVAPGGVAEIFHKLESNKEVLHIKHFSISQTTLDEVFVNFAMGKIGMRNTAVVHDADADSLDSFEDV